MHTYKRTLWSLIKGIGLSLFAGIFGYFVSSFFSENPMIIYGATAVAALLFLYISIFSENIKFTIENGEFKYYQKGQLRNQLQLRDCSARYRIKTSSTGAISSNDAIDLYLMPAGATEEIHFDCEPLGQSQFYEMFEDITQYCEEQALVLETKKKGD